jgi:hypothetical protein
MVGGYWGMGGMCSTLDRVLAGGLGGRVGSWAGGGGRGCADAGAGGRMVAGVAVPVARIRGDGSKRERADRRDDADPDPDADADPDLDPAADAATDPTVEDGYASPKPAYPSPTRLAALKRIHASPPWNCGDGVASRSIKCLRDARSSSAEVGR